MNTLDPDHPKIGRHWKSADFQNCQTKRPQPKWLRLFFYLQHLADMQDFQILVLLFDFAELHEAAWAFGDDDVGVGGFEVLVFVFQNLCGGFREIQLKGAGAATAHGGIGGRKVSHCLF